MIKSTNSPQTPDRGWMGDSKRGASLGRPTIGKGATPTSLFTLQRVRLDSGGYDQGGSYWGLGDPLYWYSAESPDGEISGYVRGRSRKQAKAEVRETHPDARFFR